MNFPFNHQFQIVNYVFTTVTIFNIGRITRFEYGVPILEI